MTTPNVPEAGSVYLSITRHLLAGTLAAVLILGGIVGWASITEIAGAVVAKAPVSYTHLTLPTTPYV